MGPNPKMAPEVSPAPRANGPLDPDRVDRLRGVGHLQQRGKHEGSGDVGERVQEPERADTSEESGRWSTWQGPVSYDEQGNGP